MPKNLPNRVVPWQLAQSGRIVEGQVLLAQLPRLTSELRDKKGIAWVELVFGYDEINRYFVQARIKARLQLICQRCLQPMELPVDVQTQFGLMRVESEMNRWPKEYEPWIMGPEETASLWELVEDELLLALPIVARHPVTECPQGEAFQRMADEDKERQETTEPRARPFAVLKKLKVRDQNSN